MARPKVFPCAEIIEWLLPRTDARECIINTAGEPIDSFHTSTIDKYYSSHDLEINMTVKLMQSSQLNYITFIKHSYNLDKQFFQKDCNVYETKFLKKPYNMVVILSCRLYRESNAKHFKLEWPSLLYYVIVCKLLFDNMEDAILRAQKRFFKQ